MSRIYTYPTDETFTVDDWKELCANLRPGGEGLISQRSCEDVSVGVIPFKKLPSAIAFILGYSEANGSTFKLARTCQVRHPYMQNLYARGVAYQPQTPATDAGTSAGYRDSSIPNALPKYANYQNAQLKISWAVPGGDFGNYLVTSDADLGASGEETRFVSGFRTEPYFDMLSSEGGADQDGSVLRFAEGPLLNQPASVATGCIKTGAALKLKWWAVEKSFVFKEEYPEKIMACLGTVNKYNLFDLWPAKTMLLDGAELDGPYVFPVRTTDNMPLEYYDITFVWKFFDPVRALGTDSTSRGHQLAPWRSGGPSGGPAWYAAKRDDGSQLLVETDHAQMFTHVLAP